MKFEGRWIADLGKQADMEFLSSDSKTDQVVVVQHVSERIACQRSTKLSLFLLVACVGIAVSSWHFAKLDWQMSQSSWPAYAQYQQYQQR